MKQKELPQRKILEFHQIRSFVYRYVLMANATPTIPIIWVQSPLLIPSQSASVAQARGPRVTVRGWEGGVPPDYL